ncbi:MAG: tetratricopeptide repeat protein [Planctomycetota bacterium]|nr:tetratricopeptide repeat protein [Planctomycetota bacterium]
MSGQFVAFLVLSVVVLEPLAAQDRSAERYQLALGLINRGMHDDAARQLSRFVEDQSSHDKASEANYRLGVCYLELKKPEQAIAAFRRALRGRPFKFKAECRYRLGHTLKQDKQDAEAAIQFRQLVAEAGDKHYLAAPSLFAEGESLRKTNDEDAALSAYRKCADLDTDKDGRFAVTALYQAGFIQLRRGVFLDASKLFQRAGDRYPKHAAFGECRFLQGEAALRAGDSGAARAAFESAAQASGDFADDAAMGLGYASVKQEQMEQAIAEFQQVIDRFPRSPLVGKAMLERGRALYKSRKFEPAVEQLNALLKRSSEPAEIRWPGLELRGIAYLDLGDTKAAEGDLVRAIQMATKPADQGRMYYSLAEAYADDAQWSKALGAYRECCTKSEDQVRRGEALYGQCLALHRLQRYLESNELVREFLEKFEHHDLVMTARFALAENLFGLKQYPDADKAYGQIPADHKLSGKALFKGAWCSYLSGDYKSAAMRFAGIANSRRSKDKAMAEESLSMEALAWLDAASLDKALQAADRYQDANPEGRYIARTERVAARVLKRQGKWKLAASRLSRAAANEKSPERVFADKLEFAEVLFKQGDFSAASAAYLPLVERADKIGGRAHEGLAWCAFELGEDAQCVDWVERGIKHPAVGDGKADLLELLSALNHRNEDWAGAVLASQRFLKTYPKHARADEMRYTLGVAQSRTGKLKNARETLESVRNAKLSRPDRLFYELGWVCRRSKDEPAALVAFGQAAAVSKDKDLAGESRLHIGEALLKQNRPDEALAQLQQVRGKYEGRAQYSSGFLRFEQKKFAAARHHFERIVEFGVEHDLYYEAQFFVGETKYRERDYAGATDRYAKLIGRQPDHVRTQVARLHHGESLVRTSRALEASGVLRDYLQRLDTTQGRSDGDPARANLWLGQAWYQLEDWVRAEAAFTVVTNLTDDELSAEAQFRIGETRRANGKLDAAVEAFVKLSILYGHANWVQRSLDAAGDCYLELGKSNKASKLFDELIQRFPDSDLAKRAHTKLQNSKSR